MKFNRICLSITIYVLTAATPAWAVGSAGFENASFSTEALSQSNAVVAQANEPAAISYNPAGIIQLDGIQVQQHMAMISQITHYSSKTQGNTRSSGTLVPVPTGYLTINPGKYLGNRVAFGIGSDSPFGLTNKWDSNHPALKYTAYTNYLKMFTVKPVVAIKVNDWLSIGGGPVFHRVFKFGGVQAYPNLLIVPGSADGEVRLNMKGSKWGWQLGVLVKPHEKHQLGYSFRSPVTIRTTGTVKVDRSAFGGNFAAGANGDLELPMNMTWAYAYKPNPKTVLEADFGFTRWSAHKRLYTNADPVNALDDIILRAIGRSGGNDSDYRNSFSFHLGGKRQVTKNLSLMGGTLFYTAAVPKTHFLPRIPDANRLAFSAGMSYRMGKHAILDLGYLHMFNLRRNIDNTNSEAIPGTSVDGKYFSTLSEITASVRFMWEDIFGGGPNNQGQEVDLTQSIPKQFY